MLTDQIRTPAKRRGNQASLAERLAATPSTSARSLSWSWSGRRGRRPRPRLGLPDRARARLQGARLRLPRRGRAAQQARRLHRHPRCPPPSSSTTPAPATSPATSWLRPRGSRRKSGQGRRRPPRRARRLPGSISMELEEAVGGAGPWMGGPARPGGCHEPAGRQGRGGAAGLGQGDRTARRQNQRLLEASSEPIAIVGMACRFPGGVDLAGGACGGCVADGADAIVAGSRPTAAGTWSASTTPTPAPPATTYVREGGFLADAADFDPDFFGIARARRWRWTPSSACCWKRLGGAGASGHRPARRCAAAAPASSPGSMYQRLRPAGRGARGLPLTGTTASVVSGRVAYTLGLEGPAVTVDTACSSSLVAMHLAAQALRGGRVRAGPGGRRDRARPPRMSSSSSPASAASRPTAAASPSPRRPTASAAPRASACSCWSGSPTRERNGHPVLAVIRGSAVNQDGASNGLTAPNGPSQERVIRQALADARLAPADVDAVEAHGTGTTLGDPIEARRPARHLRPGPPRRRCGSARSSRTSATPRRPPGSPG